MLCNGPNGLCLVYERMTCVRSGPVETTSSNMQIAESNGKLFVS